jgi:transmembrane sensor
MNSSSELEMADEASRWINLLRDSPQMEQHSRQEFAEWLRRSPCHINELLVAAALDEAMAHFKPDAGSIDEWTAVARRAATWAADPPAEQGGDLRVWRAREAEDGASEPRRRWHRGRLRWGGAIAAAILGVLVSFLGVQWIGRSAEVTQWRTTSSGHKQITLSDGSILRLYPSSSVEARITPWGREVHLREGHASFKVQHDALRSFQVRVGAASVKAIGTEFVVRRHAQMAWVEVTEGRVLVTAREGEHGSTAVAVGEWAAVHSDGHIQSGRRGQNSRAAIFHESPLLFMKVTLGEMAEEIGRYSRIRLVVNEEVRNRRISGLFQPSDRKALIQALSKEEGLEVKQDADTVWIGKKDKAQAGAP